MTANEAEIVYKTKLHYYDLDCIELYPGSKVGRDLLKTDASSYIKSISHLINKDRTLILNDHFESFDSYFLNFSDQVFKQLMNEKGFDRRRLIIVSGALPIVENYLKYIHHCKKNNLNIYPIIFDPYFQSSMAIQSIRNPLVYNYHPSTRKTNIFLFLNGQPRTHRIYLLVNLFQKNILEKCEYSFFASFNHTKDLIRKVKNNVTKEKLLVQIEELKDIQLPKELSIKQNDRLSQHSISEKDLVIFDKTYISLIAETVFFKKELFTDFSHDYWTTHLDGVFLTEKTFRAIACKHPFIIASRPYTLKGLKQLGYQTFSPYIDESYDDIEDDYKRLDKIVDIMKELADKDQSFWDDFTEKVKPILEHNFKLLQSNKKPYLYCPLKQSNL